MTIFELLTSESGGLGIPVVYSHFDNLQNDPNHIEPPYVAYIGNGQDNFEADNTYFWNRNRYQIEYYFTKKNEEIEAEIESLLVDNGYLYDKSEDVYIEDQGVFVIYYQV